MLKRVVVSNVSKVINLKAIHNWHTIQYGSLLVVSNVSKVINLKAIHNELSLTILIGIVVSNVSKVINLKAIHNLSPRLVKNPLLFPMCQRR